MTTARLGSEKSHLQRAAYSAGVHSRAAVPEVQPACRGTVRTGNCRWGLYPAARFLKKLSGVARRGSFALCFPHPVIHPFRSQSSAYRDEELGGV